MTQSYSLDTFVLLQRHRRAPIDFADEDEVGLRIVGGTVPFRPTYSAWTEVNGLVGGERRLGILDPRRWRAIEHGVGGEIEAIKVSILGRDR
jgi:hypothetical protein